MGITLGQIIILNGVPRSGKSSIVAVIREAFDGPWMRPGIGLRPGGERPDLDPLIVVLYAAMYESIATHSRLGLNVVVDVGHNEGCATPQKILADSARRLDGLPVLFLGVRCCRAAGRLSIS